MNRLQLATLISWAGDQGLQGRKRLQKIVFCLQQTGCPLDCWFTLHYFGPYSRDVAAACDEMVASGLIDEHRGLAGGSMQYTYSLTAATRDWLKKATENSMMRYRELARSLLNEDVRQLELGSTVLYYFVKRTDWKTDWKAALVEACKYKKVSADADTSQSALALAKRVHGHANRT